MDTLKTWQNYQRLSEIWKTASLAARTPPDRNATEWAEANVIFPPGAAMPGPFRGSVTPYMTEISQAARNPLTEWVSMCMGSQMAKTQMTLNLVGHKIDDDPVPTGYVSPTRDLVMDGIEPRIQRMIDEAPTLKAKYLGGKASKKHLKRIAGIELFLLWAGSDSQMASRALGMVVLDELDQMRGNNQGNALEQAQARMETFADSLGVVSSTPTDGTVEVYVDEHGIERWKVADADDLDSMTWRVWQEGSREEYAVPCPHCNEHFVPRFRHLKWPADATLDEIAKSAFIACPRNGCVIEDTHRTEMIDRGTFLGPGQWIDESGAKRGELISVANRSFWVSGLCSKFSTWGSRAQTWVKAARSKDQESIKSAINTQFGELYQLKGDAPDWQIVRNCAGEYRTGVAPEGVQIVFITVDVQKNRLVYVVRGWGYAFESWGIEAGEIYAATDTSDPDDICWQTLSAMLDYEFSGIPVSKVAIDSQYHTDAVDTFCKRHTGVAWPTRGAPTKPIRPFVARDQEINDRGRRIKTGLKRWTLDHGYFKQWVYERLQRPQDAAGAWHVARDMGTARDGGDSVMEPTEDYCKQVVSETRVTFASGAEEWRTIHDDNHILDCEYIQVFLAHQQRVGDLDPIEEESTPPPTPAPTSQRSESSWLRRPNTGSWMR